LCTSWSTGRAVGSQRRTSQRQHSRSTGSSRAAGHTHCPNSRAAAEAGGRRTPLASRQPHLARPPRSCAAPPVQLPARQLGNRGAGPASPCCCRTWGGVPHSSGSPLQLTGPDLDTICPGSACTAQGCSGFWPHVCTLFGPVCWVMHANLHFPHTSQASLHSPQGSKHAGTWLAAF